MLLLLYYRSCAFNKQLHLFIVPNQLIEMRVPSQYWILLHMVLVWGNISSGRRREQGRNKQYKCILGMVTRFNNG